MTVKPCERCRWKLYLEDQKCMLTPWHTLYCQEHDYCYFDERIIHEECIECHTVED